jgi:hypothetical protein
MAETHKTVEAELILRYSTGKETSLGAVTIEVDAHYQFSFSNPIRDHPLPETAIKVSLASIQGASE